MIDYIFSKLARPPKLPAMPLNSKYNQNKKMLLCREYMILLLYNVIEPYGLEEELGLSLHLDSYQDSRENKFNL
jgi:hypothetical protein